ncbi:MAG: NGG1p interacting factor NIF3 [Gammaproteobacteria bacterium]|nr:NGG1p interacting factor NIF3 [Gammaproteobacteria bacterium]
MSYYQIYFHVPELHAEEVKKAIFEAGAGQIENYDKCAWQTSGVGQFRPLEGSHPHLGMKGKLSKVDEVKVETVYEESKLEAVVAALKAAHPYESVAYGVIKLEEF